MSVYLARSAVCRSGRAAIRRVCKGTDKLFIHSKGDTHMRFMMIVKASKESETGVMPSEKALAEMAKYNEALVKAGVMLAGDRAQAQFEGRAHRVLGQQADGRRRPVRRNQGADRRILDHPGRSRRKRPSSGRSACRSKTARSSSGSSSSWRISRRDRPSSTTGSGQGAGKAEVADIVDRARLSGLLHSGVKMV